MPDVELITDHHGLHHCTNCDSAFWQTVAALNSKGEAKAILLTSTVCYECGFPLVHDTGTGDDG